MRQTYRILDANLNRARESLRVIEDFARFALDDASFSASVKKLRSRLQELSGYLPGDALLGSRDTPGDVGTRISSPTEGQRADASEVLTAAFKRLSEALRTLEEYSKLTPTDRLAGRFQELRYEVYTLEQRLTRRLKGAERFRKVGLYVVLTKALCQHSPGTTARSAIEGGADCIQLREKDMPDRDILELAAELRAITSRADVLLIVNDRPDIAAAVGADGVHLGQKDVHVAAARRVLPPWSIVGHSTHNRAELDASLTAAPDYIAVGPMFPTRTKDAGPIAGVEFLRMALAECPLPVVPIGGITPDNVEQLVVAGARRVAVCSAVIAAKDPAAAAAAIKGKLPSQPGE